MAQHIIRPPQATGDLFRQLVQIVVGRWMAQDTAHGDDLAFVVEGVGKDVMEHERRRALSTGLLRAKQNRGFVD